jgi:hypothetical protein
MDHLDDDRGPPDDWQDGGGALATQQPQQNQIARTDLMGASLSTTNAATEALIAKERASIEARWIMAMRRPRNLDDVRQRVLAECRRPGFAESAIYHRPAGNKQDANGKWVPNIIEGLSIRFAEVAVRCMTNIPVETQTIFDGDRDRVVRVTVTDLESNVTWSRDITIKKTVERKQLKKGQRPLGERVNSYGDRVFIVEATDDEVSVKEAAMISKMSRTLILRCVPGNIQDEAKMLCRKISADKTAQDPAAAKTKVLDAFSTLGVLPSQLADYLGKPLEQARPPEIDSLRNLYTAIRDGELTWIEAYAEATDGRDKKSPPPTIVPAAASEAPAASTPAPASTTAPSSTEKTTQPMPTSTRRASGTDKLKQAIAPQAPSDDDAIRERPCADCGVPIEGAKGARCEACRNS